ncbi:MAG TPA: hypothetical protein VFV37_10785 [Luteibaculaceae bacterium]|jgi:hypothetical protein|nr:hypothetical protein [Luteibaculaceae bacterium]
MQIAEIKRLAEHCSLDQLLDAEEALLNEQEPAIEVNGKDEGERLTHIMAAQEIAKDVANHGVSMGEAVRNFSQRVRRSIS